MSKEVLSEFHEPLLPASHDPGRHALRERIDKDLFKSQSGSWSLRRSHVLLALVALFGLAVIWEATESAGGLHNAIEQGALPFLHASDESARLAYRYHLEKTQSPHGYTIVDNSTLGFGNIYVVSVPAATERRDLMQQLGQAQGMDLEIFDAVPKNLPVIDWIADRVAEMRAARRPILAAKFDKPPKEVGGGGTDSVWLYDRDPAQGLDFPQDSVPQWTVDGHAASWTEYLASMDTGALQSNATEQQVWDKLWDGVEQFPWFHISAGTVACFYSHVLMWQDIVAKGYGTALIMEDDIDLEWDMDRLVPNVMRALPDDWDIIYLGHCWTDAQSQPKYLNPIVRKAAHPMCTHGYALSQKGARRLLEVVASPWTSYTVGVDTAMARAHKDGKINAFLVDPPLIIQTKESKSTVQNGGAEDWRGLLMDSTLDRVRKDKGLPVKQLTWENTKNDPNVWQS